MFEKNMQICLIPSKKPNEMLAEKNGLLKVEKVAIERNSRICKVYSKRFAK
jgi:hypothetical protein